MKKLLVVAVLLASCSTPSQAPQAESFISIPTRALACPGSGGNDICLLFQDASVATVSYSATTDGTFTGNFLTAGYSIPLTGFSNNSALVFSFCATAAESTLSQSKVEVPQVSQDERFATLTFAYTQWKANRLALRPHAYERDDFPTSTTVPGKDSAQGDWLLYSENETATSLHVLQHDALMLFVFDKADKCSTWYAIREGSNRFRIPTGWEGVPDFAAQTFAYFSSDYMTGSITQTSTDIAGGSHEKTWHLKRP